VADKAKPEQETLPAASANKTSLLRKFSALLIQFNILDFPNLSSCLRKFGPFGAKSTAPSRRLFSARSIQLVS
jgi:hypothetical protein